MRNRKKKQFFPIPESSEAVHDFGAKITTAWQKAVAGILETGRLLIEAKAQLTFGQFGGLFDDLPHVERKVPFCQRTAERLMKIAQHPVLSNSTHESHLPASWATLSLLSAIPEERLEKLIDSRQVHPGLMRDDAQRLIGKSLNKVPGAFKIINDAFYEYRDTVRLVADLRQALEEERWAPFHLIDEALPARVAEFYKEWARVEAEAQTEARQVKRERMRSSSFSTKKGEREGRHNGGLPHAL